MMHPGTGYNMMQSGYPMMHEGYGQAAHGYMGQADSNPLKRRRPDGPTSACDTLCVRQLPSEYRDAEVATLFERCQGMEKIHIIFSDRERQLPTAFVRFSSIEEATQAMRATDGMTVQGGHTPLAVEYARRSLLDSKQ